MMILGRGNLSWHSFERQTDRYGAVHLGSGTREQAKFENAPVGKVGLLVAEFKAPGLYSSRPVDAEIGQVFVLGEGELFLDTYTYPTGNLMAVGVRPLDGRDEGWMDSRILYLLKDNFVELRFEEID